MTLAPSQTSFTKDLYQRCSLLFPRLGAKDMNREWRRHLSKTGKEEEKEQLLVREWEKRKKRMWFLMVQCSITRHTHHLHYPKKPETRGLTRGTCAKSQKQVTSGSKELPLSSAQSSLLRRGNRKDDKKLLGKDTPGNYVCSIVYCRHCVHRQPKRLPTATGDHC